MNSGPAGEIGVNKRPAMAPRQLDAAEVARIAQVEVENGEAFSHISGLTTLAAPGDFQLIFLDRFSEETVLGLQKIRNESVLFAAPPEYRGHIGHPAVFSATPRELFSALAVELFDYYGSYWTGFEDGPAAQARHPATTLFPGTQIHASATIGEGTIIFPGAIVGPNVRIGKRALIKPRAVIGFPGFGIFRNSAGRNTHFPHVGGVEIGDDVELGALTTVCAGTIHPTIIGHGVKTDDHVHIAHNCNIGDGAQIAAHAELSGSVTVGKNSWLSPNISVVNGLTIGDGAFVGIAANVTKDVQPDTLVAGNPAKALRTLSSPGTE